MPSQQPPHPIAPCRPQTLTESSTALVLRSSHHQLLQSYRHPHRPSPQNHRLDRPQHGPIQQLPHLH
jgi:hypothetical protein